MVALISRISGDAAGKESRQAVQILYLHSTSTTLHSTAVTPRLKISNIWLHMVKNKGECELSLSSQLQKAEHDVNCNTLNEGVSCVPNFLTLSI